jgi:hypothetical protein
MFVSLIPPIDACLRFMAEFRLSAKILGQRIKFAD